MSDQKKPQPPAAVPVETLLRAGPAVIYALRNVDGQWLPVYVSPNLDERLGYSPAGVLGDPDWWSARVHPDDRERALQALTGLLEKGHWEHEYRFLNGHETYIWVRDALGVVRNDQGEPEWIIGAWLDITTSKQDDHRIRSLNRTLHLITECNQAMIRATSVQELLGAVCQQLVDTGGYRLAWVGLVDEEDPEHRVRPAAWAGLDAGYLKEIVVTWGDEVSGRGPTGAAIRTGKTQMCADIHNEPCFAPWRQAALTRGYASSIALPLVQQGRVYGALNIYAGQTNAFPTEEQALLEEMAGDIAYGIRVLHEREDRELTRQHLQTLYDASPDMIFIHGPDGRLLDVNGNVLRSYGFIDRQAFLETDPEQLMGGGHSLPEALRLVQRAQGGEPLDFEWIARRRDGSEFPVEVRLRRLGETRNVLALVRDISTRKSLEARLEHQAYYDELTGLPNRRLAGDRIRQALLRARRTASRATLMLLDLDNFKHINDSFGHDTGDRLLVEVAQRLRGTVRASDTVSRLGGDEFLILMSEVHDDEDILNLADKILRVFDRPMPVSSQEILTSTSIGIARYPEDGRDQDILFRAADSAMYQAKQDGRNTYRFFSPDINRRMERYLTLGAALHGSLERGEFHLVYQPLVAPDGGTHGVEALLRWRHPSLGEVPPDEFIPVAEDRGLIVPIGRWVLNGACRQMHQWQAQGLNMKRVSVNLSPRQFWEQDLELHIQEALAGSGLAATALELEITEGLLMDRPPQALAALKRLHHMGVHLALDDFGTGYSSLSYLKRYPFDSLKIDRSFVQDLDSDQDDQHLVRTIIAMARTLGLRTVAEGVENAATTELLRQEGCDLLQGYYFSRPLPQQDLEHWLRHRNEQGPLRNPGR